MSSPVALLHHDDDRRYEALLSRDRRFDGQFIAGITSTGIYCRPSCPAPVRPLRKNVRFFTTAAAAQSAGLRSCKRCRPDASPGSPEWDLRGDLVGRAMVRIERGDIDRIGVAGVAAALHVSERHLHRTLHNAVGVGPLSLARAQRANLARTLLETANMPITEVAFAAGFSSIRQFNDTIKAVYAQTPSALRDRAKRASKPTTTSSPVDLTMWLPVRWPIDLDWMFSFHQGHGIPGVTSTNDGPAEMARTFRRGLALSNGSGLVEITADPGADPERPGVWASFALDNIADLAEGIARVRTMFDLDADPELIAEHFRNDTHVAQFFRARPGVGVPGAADGFEAAVSAIIGQQISVAGARTILGRLVTAARSASDRQSDETLAAFPSADTVAELDLASIGMTTRRAATISTLATAVSRGELLIDVGENRESIRHQLLELPGIGPWTADVICMRALRDPDVMLASDLVVKRRLRELDIRKTNHWAPWRSYVACTLWATRDRPVEDRRRTVEDRRRTVEDRRRPVEDRRRRASQ